MIDQRLRPHLHGILEPIGRTLVKLGFTPTVMTVLGLLVAIVGSVVIGFGQLFWGGLIALGGSAIDGLDGSVARASNQVTTRGAYLDSIFDRVGEISILTGLAVSQRTDARILLLCLLCLGGALLIPYIRAKAETLGINGKGGILGRAERVILATVGAMTGLVEPMLWIFLVVAWFTVGQRFMSTYQSIPPGSGD